MSGDEMAGYPTLHELEQVMEGYLECALWSTTDEEGNPLDDDYCVSDIDGESVAAMRSEVLIWLQDNRELLANMDDGQIGHDLWLTRNHHGAGFWDRGLGERGDRLTESAHALGSSDLYVGDDGKVYAT